MNFNKLFLDYCRVKGFEINDNQIITVELISKFYKENFDHSFFSNLFSKKKIFMVFICRVTLVLEKL